MPVTLLDTAKIRGVVYSQMCVDAFLTAVSTAERSDGREPT